VFKGTSVLRNAQANIHQRRKGKMDDGFMNVRNAQIVPRYAMAKISNLMKMRRLSMVALSSMET
jgi:hypothetical protein